MTLTDVLGQIRTRAIELRERSNERIRTIGRVSKDQETVDQRDQRSHAQAEFIAADELERIAKEIEDQESDESARF